MIRLAPLVLTLAATAALAQPAPKPRSCLNPSSIRAKTIQDGVLIVTTIGGQEYRNPATAQCAALERWRPNDPMIFTQLGAQLCRGDRLTIADAVVPSPPCILGRFEPLAKK